MELFRSKHLYVLHSVVKLFYDCYFLVEEMDLMLTDDAQKRKSSYTAQVFLWSMIFYYF